MIGLGIGLIGYRDVAEPAARRLHHDARLWINALQLRFPAPSLWPFDTSDVFYAYCHCFGVSEFIFPGAFSHVVF